MLTCDQPAPRIPLPLFEYENDLLAGRQKASRYCQNATTVLHRFALQILRNDANSCENEKTC